MGVMEDLQTAVATARGHRNGWRCCYRRARWASGTSLSASCSACVGRGAECLRPLQRAGVRSAVQWQLQRGLESRAELNEGSEEFDVRWTCWRVGGAAKYCAPHGADVQPM